MVLSGKKMSQRSLILGGGWVSFTLIVNPMGCAAAISEDDLHSRSGERLGTITGKTSTNQTI